MLQINVIKYMNYVLKFSRLKVVLFRNYEFKYSYIRCYYLYYELYIQHSYINSMESILPESHDTDSK